MDARHNRMQVRILPGFQKGGDVENTKLDTLLNAVKNYLENEGVCAYAYDDTHACLLDDCPYCAMVRAYIDLQGEKANSWNATNVTEKVLFQETRSKSHTKMV